MTLIINTIPLIKHEPYKNKIEKMRDLNITGSWNRIKKKMKQKYPILTDEDLWYVRGKADRLLRRIQKKTGKRMEDLKIEIENIKNFEHSHL